MDFATSAAHATWVVLSRRKWPSLVQFFRGVSEQMIGVAPCSRVSLTNCSQIPAKGVDSFGFAISRHIFGFRPDSFERAFAGGAAVVIRAKLQDDEIALFDLRPQVLPEETRVKTRLLVPPNARLTTLIFSNLKYATIGAPQPHWFMLEPSPRVPLRTVESPMSHTVGNVGMRGHGRKITAIARRAFGRGRIAHLRRARNVTDLKGSRRGGRGFG